MRDRILNLYDINMTNSQIKNIFACHISVIVSPYICNQTVMLARYQLREALALINFS
jgi:hypothetical protein